MGKCGEFILHKDNIDKVKKNMPEVRDILSLSNFYKIMGDPTRIKILWILRDFELCVCDISEILNMNQSAISHQLKLLRITGLVKFRKEGKVVYYSLADDHVKDIFNIGLEHIKEVIS